VGIIGLDGVDIRGTHFAFVGAAKQPWRSGSIPVRKSPPLAWRYLDLIKEFSGGRVVELGIDQGASTCFLLELLQPAGLVAVDINLTCPEPLSRFLAEHGHTGTTMLGWGISQTDGERVRALVRKQFAGGPVDLIIDDASHLIDETTASFENLFPLLRPGGLYLIEDWSWHEKYEIGLAAAVASDTTGEFARNLASRAATQAAPRPVSRLAAVLAMATAFAPDIIAEVVVRQDWLEVRRGPEPITPGFNLADLVSPIGRAWLGLGQG
jgi:predicted O-methyltransferase YrrM